MSRELPRHLIVEVEDAPRGVLYTFQATFQFTKNLQDAGIDVGQAYAGLNAGLTDPNIVEAVLTAALRECEPKQEQPVVDIIERFGLIEAATLAVDLLSRAIIGDIKKSESDKAVKTGLLMDQILPRTTWKTFARAGSLLAVISATSGILGSLIFNAFMMYI